MEAADDAILLTIFLRHDQSKPLDQINEELKRTGFRESFPPPGVEIVTWYVMMGIGQVVHAAGGRPANCATSIWRSSAPPGAPSAPSSIRPTISAPSVRG